MWRLALAHPCVPVVALGGLGQLALGCLALAMPGLLRPAAGVLLAMPGLPPTFLRPAAALCLPCPAALAVRGLLCPAGALCLPFVAGAALAMPGLLCPAAALCLPCPGAALAMRGLLRPAAALCLLRPGAALAMPGLLCPAGPLCLPCPAGAALAMPGLLCPAAASCLLCPAGAALAMLGLLRPAAALCPRSAVLAMLGVLCPAGPFCRLPCLWETAPPVCRRLPSLLVSLGLGPAGVALLGMGLPFSQGQRQAEACLECLPFLVPKYCLKVRSHGFRGAGGMPGHRLGQPAVEQQGLSARLPSLLARGLQGLPFECWGYRWAAPSHLRDPGG